jgi:hypothetical protein
MRACVAVLLLVLCAPSGWSAEIVNHPTKWSVYFSPCGGCTEAVVEALGRAKSTVLVQAYSFTSAPIAKALVEAHRRGVKVEVVLDRSQRTEKYSSATFVRNPVRTSLQRLRGGADREAQGVSSRFEGRIEGGDDEFCYHRLFGSPGTSNIEYMDVVLLHPCF